MGMHSPHRGGDNSRGRSPPMRSGRGRSPPTRSSGGHGERKDQGSISLLVRNIPLSCRYEDLIVAFKKFGPIRDVYMPKDYYSGEPRGFAFVEFFDSHDASEARYHMNHQMFCGREINVVAAVEKRKRPDDMRRRTRVRGYSDHEGRCSSRHGRSHSRSHSRSRSPCHDLHTRSRSHSHAPRSRDDYSASSKRKDEHQAKSSSQSEKHEKDKKQRSCTPDYRNDADNGSNGKRATPDYSAPPKKKEGHQTKSPRPDEDKRGYCTPDDRNESNDRRDADNVSNQRRAATDGEGSRTRRRSPRSSCGSRSRRRDDYSDSPKGKEDGLAKSPRQSKEHDADKKRRSDTPDDRNDRCDADYNQRRHDYSTSPKRKEEGQARSPKLSKEHDKDKQQKSCTPDDRNDRRDADNGSKERPATTNSEGSCPRRRSPIPSSGSRSRRRDGYSASPKRKEEPLAKSPRQSKEHDEDKNRRSYTPDARKNRCDADNGRNERDDYSTLSKRKEEHQAKSARLSNEHDKDKKHRSYTPDNIESRDADNRSKQRLATTNGEGSCPHRRSPRPSSGSRSRRQDGYSASPKRKEERLEKSPPQSKEHDEHRKRRSDTHDDRNDCRDADNGYDQRRDDYSTSSKVKEERNAKSPRLSNEHDKDKKRRSYTPDNRYDRHDADNGSKERRATPDYFASPKRKVERQSKEDDDDKKRRSYTRDDRNDRRDGDNGSKERRATGARPRQRSPRPASSRR